ncbi:hypothetical protein E0H73_38680 [Kribbella pittospori]|uniref:LPXTG cell wall anchor domain-containing protein n=1 Tax=Kribbella pittospori TaxID=722689 RepID=A0A4R0K320_9ACTN|nr:hypothetical protein [Kribbella pittospori]TCC54383.1 hypothetical protein E0H73_38680 [Kribbella pittospori]
MNRRNSAIAVSALVLGAAAFTATEASAQQPPEPRSGDTTAPVSVTQRVQVPVDDAAVEAVQAGASAVGGAGLALGGLWLYRRRQAPAI